MNKDETVDISIIQIFLNNLRQIVVTQIVKLNLCVLLNVSHHHIHLHPHPHPHSYPHPHPHSHLHPHLHPLDLIPYLNIVQLNYPRIHVYSQYRHHCYHTTDNYCQHILETAHTYKDRKTVQNDNTLH